jgi:hypothetical protein
MLEGRCRICFKTGDGSCFMKGKDHAARKEEGQDKKRDPYQTKLVGYRTGQEMAYASRQGMGLAPRKV